MVPLAIAIPATVTVVGVVAASSGAPDYVGLAAVITAVSGLVGTIGALLLAFRRKSDTQEALELIEALKGGEHDRDAS